MHEDASTTARPRSFGRGVATAVAAALLLGGTVLLAPEAAQASPGAPSAEVTSVNGLTRTPPSPVLVHDQYQFGYGLSGTPLPTTSITGGALPPGLTLDAHGLLTGWPTTPGSYTFTVTASNGASPDVSRTDTIEVDQAAFVSGIPPSPTQGRPYSFTFTLTGYPAPHLAYTGSLPDGLTLTPDGVLSGTPTQAGLFPITVTADNGVQAYSFPLYLFVYPAAPTSTIGIADSTVTEGDRGVRTATFTVELSAPSTSPVSAHWSTHNGTAKAGSDYLWASGTVTFAPGETVRTVAVRINGDQQREPTERFTVRLSRPRGAPLGDRLAVGRIVNDD